MRKIDGWIGGLAETHVTFSQLGGVFDAIFSDQMIRLINGDRFYYFWRLRDSNPIYTALSSAVATEQFKDVIERTTGAQHLNGNVMFIADSQVELSESPTDTSSGTARAHTYGDLVAAKPWASTQPVRPARYPMARWLILEARITSTMFAQTWEPIPMLRQP